MDSAYDQIQEKNYAGEQENLAAGQPQDSSQAAGNFNAEVQEAYKAISSSPWAARLGGFWQTAKKQGEQYYETAAASKQYQDASAGVATLLSQARNLSVQPDDGPTRSAAAADSSDTGSRDTGSSDARSSDARSRDARSRDAPHEDMTPHPARPDSLTADIVNEAQGIVSLFRANASKRLKELQHAEDAADEALLKFGSNLRNLLADAVTIAAPASRSHADNDGAVLFESRDSSGNKAVHATRFDAQLHVIHSTLDSFLRDPTSPQWEAWKRQFDADSKTDAIANHVAAHAELRTAMEKLVPERVDYATFWSRYYFLRHVIESEEQRRREMLKASTPAAEEEVDWSSSDDEHQDEKPTAAPKPASPGLAKSQTTIKPDADTPPTPTPAHIPAPAHTPTPAHTLKPAQPRRSNDEKSVADSDASYDVISGATSRAPSSPTTKPVAKVDEESDDDWE